MWILQPSEKYGIWNDLKKEFQFGLKHTSKKYLESELFKRIGNDARKVRFEFQQMNLWRVDSHNKAQVEKQKRKIKETKENLSQLEKELQDFLETKQKSCHNVEVIETARV